MHPAYRTAFHEWPAAQASTNSVLEARACAEKWDKFAQNDARGYIWTIRQGNDPQEFWRSGEHTVECEFLPLMRARNVRPVLALELGCGVGRLALPLARHFQHVAGVDISRSMIQQAFSAARERCINNASFRAIAGPEDFLRLARSSATRFDFIYSLLVFQHIPDLSTIEGYLRVVRVLLHHRGLAYLQFDTRPQGFSYRVKTRLPNFLLPRFWRRGIRRIRQSPEQVESSIRRADLEIVAQLTQRTAYHRYILRVPQTAEASS
jgi:SAM-dependent methyltransferase